MKCQVCKKNDAKKNSIVCSEDCQKIRLGIHKLLEKYTPAHGCENCWGDLHQGCTDKCKEEIKNGCEFAVELYDIVRLAFSEVEKECEWKYTVHYNSYETNCGEIFCLSDEIDNFQFFKFCPFCGKKIKSIKC